MPVSYGFLSTCPPTECGLATFTAALTSGLRDGPLPAQVGVVRITDTLIERVPAGVVHHLVAGAPGAAADAAEVLNGFDMVADRYRSLTAGLLASRAAAAA